MKMKITKDFWRASVTLAIPIALQNLLISSASLIDTAMIVPLGNVALSAVGVAGRFTFLLNLIAFGFCSGAASLISQYWGINDRKHIHNTFYFTMAISIVASALFAAALLLFPGASIAIFGPEADVAAEATEYLKIISFAFPFIMFAQVACAALRATENVIVPLVSSFVCVIVNTSLNFCLISGNLGFPALGVRGAAIATLIASIVQAIIVLLFMIFGKNVIKANVINALKLDKAFLSCYFKTVAPVLLNETMWAVGTNVYVMVLSRQGTEEYSAYTIFETIQQLFFVFFKGISHASAILVGKAVGRGDHDEAFNLANNFLVLTPIFGVILGVILILIRNPLLSLFDIETVRAFNIASSLLVIFGLWLGMRMIPYTAICGIFRAGGDTRIGCIFEICTIYLVGIPAVYLSGMVLSLPFAVTVGVMFVAEDLPKGIMCIIYFIKRKWIHQVTNTSDLEGIDA